MKCQVTSKTPHDVLINKKVSYKSYKEICSGEKKKVNLGFNTDWYFLMNDDSMVEIARKPENYMKGKYSSMTYDWEILSKFFAIHNFEPNFLDCNGIWGRYDEDLGVWTGCMGKV